jgi:peptidoglycan hydrolase-like protein with peptidoglycan-binding domain
MVVTPDHVKSAQQALRARGLNPGSDGKMDEKTQQALRDFQKANNLPTTGVLDQKTAEKLGVTINEQGQSMPSRGEGTTKTPSSGAVR